MVIPNEKYPVTTLTIDSEAKPLEVYARMLVSSAIVIESGVNCPSMKSVLPRGNPYSPCRATVSSKNAISPTDKLLPWICAATIS